MGLFSRSNCNYNEALDHYYKAKSSINNPVVYLSELQKAIEYLQEDIRKNRGTADALVVLANIYYAIFIWNKEVYTNKLDGMKFLLCAVALMQHWRLGWRGYNKNTDQAHLVIKMLNQSLMTVYPNLTKPETSDLFWNQTHSQFYEDALLLKVTH